MKLPLNLLPTTKKYIKLDDTANIIRREQRSYGNRVSLNGYQMQLRMLQDMHDDDIYRINIAYPNRIELICFGMDKLDVGIEGVYDNINSLPNWIQERLSVLSMLPPSSTGDNDVEGIGRRISERVYWVYAQNVIASMLVS
jgi:hypothetical protein